MAKRVVSGVEKRIKKPLIRRRRRRHNKTLIKKFVDYLKSDSYMFSPLVSHYPSDFLASNVVVSSSTAGVELMENSKGENMSLVQKIGNYLNSDSYFYAPLLAPQHSLSSKGGNGERVRMEISRKKIEVEGKETSVEESNVRVSSGQQRKETVKHMVYQSCRSTTLSGKWLDPRLGKYLIE